MSERNSDLYIEDIRDSIEKIEMFTSGMSFDQFKNDAKTIDAVVRNIEIIGEAATHMPQEMKIKYPTIPWTLIIGARNKAIHEYFGIDVAIVWQTVQEDIPLLKQAIQTISTSD